MVEAWVLRHKGAFVSAYSSDDQLPFPLKGGNEEWAKADRNGMWHIGLDPKDFTITKEKLAFFQAKGESVEPWYEVHTGEADKFDLVYSGSDLNTAEKAYEVAVDNSKTSHGENVSLVQFPHEGIEGNYKVLKEFNFEAYAKS